jgi:hypothetical protein
MWLIWLATVFSLTISTSAIARLVLPNATSDRISTSREELVELDVTVGELEDVPEGVEEAIDADVITCPFERPAKVELHVVRQERRQGLAVSVEDRLGHPVHGRDV